MFTYTVVSNGCEIGFGEESTFLKAKRAAESQAMGQLAWHPKNGWGFISTNPEGMKVKYNAD